MTGIDTAAERERRGVGRPAKAEPFRAVVAEILAGEPDLLSVEILRRPHRRRVREAGETLCSASPCSRWGVPPWST